MTTIGFLLLLGLLVFGPKKTMEMAQEIGRLAARLKGAVGQFPVENTPKEK